MPTEINKYFLLYHGSDRKVECPVWNAGSSKRDFGCCFYTTYTFKMAQDWAKRKAKDNKELPVVNVYALDMLALENGDYQIKRFEANKEWAKFIYDNRNNRKFKRPDYDIIIGPLADNGLKEQFNKIKMQEKSFDEIAPLIKYSKYNAYQITFCSDKAVKLLKLVEVVP